MKIKRQSKIVEIIKQNDIETQEELAAMLKLSGFDVTQATVSRDIRELKLSKIATENGTQKYTVYSSVLSEANFNDKFIRVFKDAVISMDYANNMIVLKTLEGMAMAVAACIDAMNHSEALGTIAGDDTIFCVVKSERDAMNMINKFKEIIQLEVD
jgi:transcriptional regulator of arginine metabolism